MVDQEVMYDMTSGEFVPGGEASGTNPITTGRYLTVDNQLTVDGTGITEFQTPTLLLGQTDTVDLMIGNSGTEYCLRGTT